MNRTGFSLVELSIVLVILGLLAGGVLTGQSLIRAAELRSITTDFSRFNSAKNAFRDKYFALAGDMNNAASFWSSSTNGDGNSIIASGSNLAGEAGTPLEMYGFWQQLALAGLIEGSYTGIAGSISGYDSIPGQNIPASKISNSGWSLKNEGVALTSNTALFEGNYGNALRFGARASGNLAITHNLSAENAWNVDAKIDDGRPGLGIVRVREGSTGCHDAGTSAAIDLAATANYALTSGSSLNCSLIMVWDR